MKTKEKFDKYSMRGIVYSCVALAGICYELLFRDDVRLFLILGYGVIVLVGVICLLYLKE